MVGSNIACWRAGCGSFDSDSRTIESHGRVTLGDGATSFGVELDRTCSDSYHMGDSFGEEEMMDIPYTKPERIDLKKRPEYDEKWVQGVIAEDPSVLGLGDLSLRDQERREPGGGRLDLLLENREMLQRFEVELQLGATDESHIIRAIEYWDEERRRFPRYDHSAVLVAESVTSRFLNVISLFHGALPLIAIQMQAFKVGDHTTLVFTTVLDKRVPGMEDEDEDVEPTDRGYWETTKSSRAIVSLADKLLELIHGFDEAVELKYNKFYIGLSKGGRAFNFVTFQPRKKNMILGVRLPNSEDLDGRIDGADIETLDYSRGMYQLRITRGDLTSKSEFLKGLMRTAYDERTGS